MRATRATQALLRLYQARPDAALSGAELGAALGAAGVPVNPVTAYRMLERFAAAGLLRRQVDAARVARFALAPRGAAEGGAGALARFECDGCHRQFRLARGAARVHGAVRQLLQALATDGHQGLAVEIAVRGRCVQCAHPASGCICPAPGCGCRAAAGAAKSKGQRPARGRARAAATAPAQPAETSAQGAAA